MEDSNTKRLGFLRFEGERVCRSFIEVSFHMSRSLLIHSGIESGNIKRFVDLRYKEVEISSSLLHVFFYIRIHIYMYTYINMFTRMRICICMHIYTYIDTCIYIYIHTYIHIYRGGRRLL